jgi:hypothetical protein
MAEVKHLNSELTTIAAQAYDQFIQVLIQHQPASIATVMIHLLSILPIITLTEKLQRIDKLKGWLDSFRPLPGTIAQGWNPWLGAPPPHPLETKIYGLAHHNTMSLWRSLLLIVQIPALPGLPVLRLQCPVLPPVPDIRSVPAPESEQRRGYFLTLFLPLVSTSKGLLCSWTMPPNQTCSAS